MIICPQCQAVNDDRNTICVRCGASLIDDPALAADPFVGRKLGRRFTLQRIVGSGEIGMVYRGLDEKTGQAVAVKIVHPDVAAIHGDELLQWARRVARIRHAKLATVLGASTEADGTTYVVSEFLEGETLRALIERVGPLPARRTADILFQLCNALAPIHKVERPHANLKPENVFLVSGQKGDFVKITDTGSPVLFGVHQTDRGQVVIGAPKYFSPEQAGGQTVGLASDQFTLGVIGYQLLSGALPFFGATPAQLLQAVQHSNPTPIAERAPTTPPALASVIERCLSKSPADRYPDLRSLARQIAGVIKSAPQPPRRKKKPFGAGLDMSTVVARPDQLPDLDQFAPLGNATGFTAADAEATVMQAVPDDIQALLDGEDGQATPAPPPVSAPLDLDDAFDDEFGDDLDLDGALADAVNAVEPAAKAAVIRPASRRQGAPVKGRRTPPRVSEPMPALGFGGGADPLAAAMAEAEAELDADAGGAAKPFNPFGDLDLTPAAEPEPAPEPAPKRPPAARIANSPPAGSAAGIAGRQSVSSLRPDDILDAIGESLGPAAARPASETPAEAASPLATAADFTRLSVPPREAMPAVGPSTTGQVVAVGRKSGPNVGLIVLLIVLLLAAGGAALWFFVLAPEEAPRSVRRPPPAKEKAAEPPAEPKADPPAPVAEAAPRTIKLVTEPPGAEVFEGEASLGKTPLDVEVKGEEPRALQLKLEGRPDTPYTLDPGSVPAPAEGEAPPEVKVELAAPAGGGADKAGEGDKPVKKTTPRRRRTRKGPKKPDPGDIRDPFADP